MSKFSEFKAEIIKNGISKPTLFKVEITPIPNPAPTGENYFEENGINLHEFYKNVSLRCMETQLPGKSISTNDTKKYGAAEHYPYEVLYDEIPLTFIVSEDLKEKKFFDAWANIVIDPKTGNTNYLAEYATDIHLYKLDGDGKKVYQYTLIDAYPKNINELEMSYGSKDEYAKLSVQFIYKKFKEINH